MSLARLLTVTWARFVATAAYEQDPGFRDIILRLCRKGMVVAGAIGIVGAASNVGAYILAGWGIDLDYNDPTAIVLWDRLIIIAICFVYLILARTRFGPRWARPLGAFIVLVIGLTVLVDDFVQGFYEADEGFHSDRYLSIAMLIIIAAIPYPPRQALGYFSVLWGVYFLSYWMLPPFLEHEAAALSPGFYVYAFLVLVACTGISGLLYHSRYEQYKTRQRTERLKARVTEQAEKLIESDRLKTRFFANISHEFRTPLTLILGPLETFLARSGSPIEAHDRPQLEVMHRNAHRLLRLINQLLDLSKLEAGSMQVRAQHGNIIRYLKGLVQAFASYAGRKKIDLQFHAVREEIDLYFDADKVEKILFNLLSNAFKFTPEGGTIRVRVSETGNEDAGAVEISVKDTGPGIPADQVAYIFDRFRQMEGAAGQARGGTGIGLALVKELAELHGGAIRVESEPGFGSEFTVTLPKGRDHLGDDQLEEKHPGGAVRAPTPSTRYEPAPSEAIRAETRPREASGDVESLLIVDDNADVRAFLRDCLEQAYHVVEARDGQDALEKARAVVPDLIIADVMMPRMDGFALCRAIKADALLNHIPVILLTARATDESKVEGLETGADDYLFKPFNADELRARVRNLIALRRKLRARFSQQILIEPNSITVKSADEVFIDRAREVVEEHMADETFNVDALAGAMTMGLRQLQRKLRALTDQTPTEFIRLLRLKRAAQLLEQQAGTVTEIAYEVGFNNPTYFATRFREVFGVSPSEYRTAGSA